MHTKKERGRGLRYCRWTRFAHFTLSATGAGFSFLFRVGVLPTMMGMTGPALVRVVEVCLAYVGSKARGYDMVLAGSRAINQYLPQQHALPARDVDYFVTCPTGQVDSCTEYLCEALHNCVLHMCAQIDVGGKFESPRQQRKVVYHGHVPTLKLAYNAMHIADITFVTPDMAAAVEAHAPRCTMQLIMPKMLVGGSAEVRQALSLRVISKREILHRMVCTILAQPTVDGFPVPPMNDWRVCKDSNRLHALMTLERLGMLAPAPRAWDFVDSPEVAACDVSAYLPPPAPASAAADTPTLRHHVFVQPVLPTPHWAAIASACALATEHTAAMFTAMQARLDHLNARLVRAQACHTRAGRALAARRLKDREAIARAVTTTLAAAITRHERRVDSALKALSTRLDRKRAQVGRLKKQLAAANAGSAAKVTALTAKHRQLMQRMASTLTQRAEAAHATMIVRVRVLEARVQQLLQTCQLMVQSHADWMVDVEEKLRTDVLHAIGTVKVARVAVQEMAESRRRMFAMATDTVYSVGLSLAEFHECLVAPDGHVPDDAAGPGLLPRPAGKSRRVASGDDDAAGARGLRPFRDLQARFQHVVDHAVKKELLPFTAMQAVETFRNISDVALPSEYQCHGDGFDVSGLTAGAGMSGGPPTSTTGATTSPLHPRQGSPPKLSWESYGTGVVCDTVARNLFAAMLMNLAMVSEYHGAKPRVWLQHAPLPRNLSRLLTELQSSHWRAYLRPVVTEEGKLEPARITTATTPLVSRRRPSGDASDGAGAGAGAGGPSDACGGAGAGVAIDVEVDVNLPRDGTSQSLSDWGLETAFAFVDADMGDVMRPREFREHFRRANMEPYTARPLGAALVPHRIFELPLPASIVGIMQSMAKTIAAVLTTPVLDIVMDIRKRVKALEQSLPTAGLSSLRHEFQQANVREGQYARLPQLHDAEERLMGLLQRTGRHRSPVALWRAVSQRMVRAMESRRGRATVHMPTHDVPPAQVVGGSSAPGGAPVVAAAPPVTKRRRHRHGPASGRKGGNADDSRVPVVYITPVSREHMARIGAALCNDG